eukprot:COSAG01_NODE_2926_length_6839_cov_5.363353_4_plen_137_part_00
MARHVAAAAQVLSQCPGLADDKCLHCVRAQHADPVFRGACPTMALVKEACAAGTGASDVWRGLSRDVHWAPVGTQQRLEERFTDRVTASLLQMQAKPEMQEQLLQAQRYVDRITKDQAKLKRAEILSEFAAQAQGS